MAEHLQLDNLDRGILNALLDNARTAYAELAKQFNVSPGTIHVRVEKMKQAGIILGTRVDIDPRQLGLMSAVLSASSLRARVTIRRH